MQTVQNLIAVSIGIALSLLTGSLLTQSASADDKKAPSAYYLTETMHAGSEALTACAAGFHMASLWEIFDTTDLTYDTTLGHIRDDSGSGPPTAGGAHGWIRTGSFSLGANDSAGLANCSAWTTSSSAQNGTLGALTFLWSVSEVTSSVAPWRGFVNSCDTPNRVWCVED